MELKKIDLDQENHLKNQLLNKGQIYYYKAVAKTMGRFLSIYNGKTEYILGYTMHEKAQKDYKGGYYVYSTLDEAIFADVPNTKEGLYLAPRTILKCMCWGNRIDYPKGKLAFENLCPVQDMGMPRGYLSTKSARQDAMKKYQQQQLLRNKEVQIAKNVEWIKYFKEQAIEKIEIENNKKKHLKSEIFEI